MKKRKKLRLVKWLHRWPSLVVAIFIICWALSGIVLNHRATFSSLDINRSILAKEYQYNNWNNASLKSSVNIGEDSVLIYGNIGVWLSDSTFSDFRDFNQGFKRGIDNRKIFKVFQTKNNSLLAGTLFGLYQFDMAQREWKEILKPDVHDKRIIGITQVKDTLFVMSRSRIFTCPDNGKFMFKERRIPGPVDYDGKISLFKTLWVIHSGELYGQIGKLIVDFVALIFIFLTVTGIIYYFAPGIIKRKKRKNKDRTRILKINRFSIKWHNKIGIWVVVILIITSVSGMFLRPPLLIAIASSRVDKIPYTSLDKPNPWYDRFRDILYDDELNRFLIGTVNGIYISEDHFKTKLTKPEVQAPISVMGINVLEKKGRGEYLVGSFMGLYKWMPDYNYLQDYITKSTNIVFNPGGPPLGKFMSAGIIRNGLSEYHVDYNFGLLPLNRKSEKFPMPEAIKVKSPMSLWNFALEVHTARFFKFLFGKYYMLVVPLLGLAVFTILITGLIVWLRLYIRRKRP